MLRYELLRVLWVCVLFALVACLMLVFDLLLVFALFLVCCLMVLFCCLYVG